MKSTDMEDSGFLAAHGPGGKGPNPVMLIALPASPQLITDSIPVALGSVHQRLGSSHGMHPTSAEICDGFFWALWMPW